MDDKNVLKIKLPIEISFKNISECFCCAFEGGSNYWYMIKSKRKPKKFINTPEDMREFPHCSYMLEEGGRLVITTETLGSEGAKDAKGRWVEYVLDFTAVLRGITLMAQTRPDDFAKLMSEDGGDADTGDTLLQLCLFGRLVYG